MPSIKLMLIHVNYIQTVTLHHAVCKHSSSVRLWHHLLPHTHPQINTEFLIYTSDPLGKQPWRLIFNNSYFFNVCREQIEIKGICFRFWCKNIKLVKNSSYHQICLLLCLETGQGRKCLNSATYFTIQEHFSTSSTS